ncbi:glutamine--fructose-6-phosphate transaminase (isomerizing) [Halorubrum gandharaense]
MCGIIGHIGRDRQSLQVLMTGLNSLEYRGYDSAGVAVGGNELEVVKRSGEIEALETALEGRSLSGTLGIGHTRWSTHGPPTDGNAHPHTSASGRVAVVHNGIIENYQSLKADLEADGVTFRSDTDTEVVPHLIEREIDAGADPETAFRRAVSALEGSYALAVVIAGTEAIFAVRNDSPLVLGVSDEEYFLGSDVPAFLEYTENVVYLDDGEYVRLDPNGPTITDVDGNGLEYTVEQVDWSVEDTGKSGYDHFMLKEIYEQPTALQQCLSGRVARREERVELEGLERLQSEPPAGVQLVACGTSYHAALYAARMFREHGVPASASIASEFALERAPVADQLVVGVTQSGETADTLSALRAAKRRGADTLAVTNVVGSTAARECDDALYIRAGPEIGVAATKTFSSQLVSLRLLVEHVAETDGVHDRLGALQSLPEGIQEVLDESRAKELAEEYVDQHGYFFIGRGYNYPVSLEGALKFKEITYEHAEGFASGELKHGTLALVTENTPVIATVTGDDETAHKTLGNVKEVEARGAPVIAVTDGRTEVDRYADAVLDVPKIHPSVAPILANTQLQLFAYHVANELDRSIDKPRNLAKSVTVE